VRCVLHSAPVERYDLLASVSAAVVPDPAKGRHTYRDPERKCDAPGGPRLLWSERGCPLTDSEAIEKWFRSMPESWQRGLIAATKGQVFLGEMEGNEGRVKVCVAFMPVAVANRLFRGWGKGGGT
jgi:hypothetical protein